MKRRGIMQFNTDKCFNMKACRRKTIMDTFYKLHDNPLQSTDFVKYLGLTLTSDIKFNTYIINITVKANRILGLLRRNLKISSHAVKTQAYFGYQSLVRPHLGVCCHGLKPTKAYFRLHKKSGNGAETCCKVCVQSQAEYQQY